MPADIMSDSENVTVGKKLEMTELKGVIFATDKLLLPPMLQPKVYIKLIMVIA